MSLSTGSDNPYAGGGRIAILFLLFLLSLYSLYTQGLNGFAITFAAVPVAVIAFSILFHWKLSAFWLLFVVNYFIFFIGRMGYYYGPLSLPNEVIEMLLIGLAVIDAGIMRFEKVANWMGFALLIWCAYCTLEALNDTCGLGFNMAVWYSGMRLIALQLLYGFIVYAIYIDNYKRLKTLLYLWAGLAIFASLWTWKQAHIGFTAMEEVWFESAKTTHFVNGITRYPSIFNDAATHGVGIVSTAVLYIVLALTSKLKRDKILFLVTALLCSYSMSLSGTRTGMICLLAGLFVYIFLSKSMKLGVTVSIIGLFLVCFLKFTTIGNGNSVIRRMRSAFNPEDASSNVRKQNQAVMAKYLKDAPWGIGIGVDYSNVPANNKFRTLSTIPPDSEYVYIWVHTGPIGISVFVFTTLMMWLGACSVVLFRLRNRSMQGVGAGICCAFFSMQLGGYANQVLMQFPNMLLFYGSLAIVYNLPRIEEEYVVEEEKRYQQQLERERLKEEKKRASRV